MTALGFACTGVRSAPYAAGPTLVFRLRITAPADTRVHALALQCQLRIEPVRRPYTDAEGERLADLFGGRERWATTLNPIQFATVPLLVPGFTGETEADLVVPCGYDLEVACARYFRALEDGEVPLLLLFSGTAFAGPGGFQVTPVPWDKEARVRMPVRVWREAVDQHFPGCGWLRLPEDVLDDLLAYRSGRALPSWEATVRALLATAAVGEGAR
ncbi:DUF6084 family protein [Streptomyces sp. CBMA123]|uniref:DUF6084 family protein n=1 Tax=Streptomyces sp. CBMA123 TaxID=1896313 RepID=UPI001661A218|nr:DUF6084 family protein [Streptomyces sp. CBMA123]MBD0694837.1 hypothetical protein [Streptomyces sp. CBMA123]